MSNLHPTEADFRRTGDTPVFLTSDVTLATDPGVATAGGDAVIISSGATVAVGPGNAIASGPPAVAAAGATVSAGPGNAIASGQTVLVNGVARVTAASSNATASGDPVIVRVPATVAAGSAPATASGTAAIVRAGAVVSVGTAPATTGGSAIVRAGATVVVDSARATASGNVVKRSNHIVSLQNDLTNLGQQYSGIVVNQRAAVENGNDLITGVVYQDFYLPADYTRGLGNERVIPSLTGVQLFMSVLNTEVGVAVEVQRFDPADGWTPTADGSATVAPFIGDQWLNVFLDAPLAIEPGWLTQRFRLQVTIEGQASCYYSVPNPLDNSTDASRTNRAYLSDFSLSEIGGSPVLDAGREVSLRFRVLANVVDSGVDALGNVYRSVAIRQPIVNANPSQAPANATWMSGPQPSRFAVVNLYFDQRGVGGVPVVIDRVLVDPVTPNVFFHLYYSNDDVDPVNYTADDWDNLLWTHVPATFQARRRETHALPEPITARFIKVEFSHLQAKQYSAGDFQKPILYSKHPKWVLDYFLARSSTGSANDAEDNFVASSVAVTFDALDFAYNYYLDDLQQAPDAPVLLSTKLSTVKDYLAALNDASDKVDATTLRQINTTLNPWTSSPAAQGKANFLPSQVALATDARSTAIQSYPSEGAQADLVFRSTLVSNVDREPILIEQGYPVMFFFVPCRHKYRVVSAPLSHDRAYFVGIREIQFDRDLYTSVTDGSVYTDVMSDGINTERNDMLQPTFITTLDRT